MVSLVGNGQFWVKCPSRWVGGRSKQIGETFVDFTVAASMPCEMLFRSMFALV